MKKRYIYHYLALVLAIWFAISSYFWVYYINLVVSFPAGILSFYMFNKAKKQHSNLVFEKAIVFFLLTGCLTAFCSLFMFI
jgi:hypothetical protein